MKHFLFMLIMSCLLCIASVALATTLNLPQGTLSIEEEAFFGDTSITDVKINSGCESIGARAFANSGITQISFPTSVSDIAEDSFDNCEEAMVATVVKDSYAYSWCIEHNIAIQILDQTVTINNFNSMKEGMTSAILPYLDANNYINRDNKAAAINAMYEYLKAYQADGIIYSLEYNPDGISFIDAIDNFVWVWNPRIEDQLSGENQVQITIMTYEPFYNAQKEFRADPASETGAQLASSISYYNIDKQYSDSNVTINTIKNIASNQVVLWFGHGGYALTERIPYLATGEEYDQEKHPYYSDSVYKAGKVGIIHKLMSEAGSKCCLCITPSFILNHCGKMENSLIWISACHSGQSERLASAFLQKGATAVVGFTESTGIKFAGYVTKKAFDLMTQIDSSTGKHYSLGKAVELATANASTVIMKPLYPNPDGGVPRVYYGPDVDSVSLWHGIVSGYIYEKAESEKKNPAKNVAVKIQNTRFASINLTVVTDSNGFYEMYVPAGVYKAQLSGDEYLTTVIDETFEVTSEETTTKNWYISKAGILKGTVSTKEGKPIEGAEISTRFDNAFTDENGHYEIAMNFVETKVTVSADKYDSEEFTIEVPADVTVIKDVILKPAKGRVVGYVKENDISGPGIEGATITAADSEGNAVTLLADNSWTTTTSDGYYMVQLDPGLYTLTATKDGFSSSVTVEVKSDEIISQDIILQRNCKILFDGNGGTVSNETITVVKGDPIGELPTASNGDKRLKEWNTEPDGNGVAITSAYIPDDDMTVYAIWNERGTAYEGSVFQCLSNNYVQGVTVELHRGAKQVEYYNERIAGGCASGETEITERELAPYESEIIDSCVTDSNGHYTLYLPFDGEPNYTSYNVSFYAYTLVFRKDGWITKYVSSAFRNEDEVASRSPYIYALAPEGEGIRYEVTIPSVGTQSSIIHPYSSYEFNYLGNMYSATYDITRVNLYLNGAYKVGYSAPSYVSQTNWRLGFYSDGYFYLVNKTYKDTYPTGSYLYPSWVNK